MIILRDPSLVSSITDPDIRLLVEQRFFEICAGEPYDYDLHGDFIVVEPGDTVEALEEESGCPILGSFFDDSRFGDSEFVPSFEYLEEHDGCFEMGFILNDEGFGIDIWIPKIAGIDAELLSLCSQYAVPVTI